MMVAATGAVELALNFPRDLEQVDMMEVEAPQASPPSMHAMDSWSAANVEQHVYRMVPLQHSVGLSVHLQPASALRRYHQLLEHQESLEISKSEEGPRKIGSAEVGRKLEETCGSL
jgi:hypothetical protein